MSLAPLVVLLGGAEIALRMAKWPTAPTGAKFAHNEVYWKEPASLHLEGVPHKETGGTFRVSTDANGLRAPLHTVERTEGIARVMTLGCSTTFGWGVEDDESYPARLEKILTEEGRKVEVVNGGQPGHSSFQGLWMWDTVLAQYRPDVVVFGYIVQDARSVAYTDQSQAVLQHNAEFLKHNVLYNLRVYQGLRKLLGDWQIEAKDNPGAEGQYRVPPDEYVANIRAFRERADAVGAKLVLFGFPLEREGYTAEHRAILKAASQDANLGAPLYDPQQDFERFSSTRTLYFPQDRGHANAAGNDLIAQGMAQFLVAQRLVP